MVLSDYFVSGIWKDNGADITHLHVHRVNTNGVFGVGTKK